jgi:hypothetical protein
LQAEFANISALSPTLNKTLLPLFDMADILHVQISLFNSSLHQLDVDAMVCT